MNGESSVSPDEPLDAQIVQQAIAWSMKLHGRSIDPAVQAECEAWLAAHPSHALAWKRIQMLREEWSERGAALPDREAGVTALETAGSPAQQQRRRVLKLLSLGTVVAVPGVWFAREAGVGAVWGADHATAAGERRRMTLSDGSVLALNTDSAVDLRFDAEQRLIHLRQGELMVASGADAGRRVHRPLRVQTRDAVFEALGTRFVVRQDDRATRLSVLQDTVAIHPQRGTRPATMVSAPSIFVVDEHGVSVADDEGLQADAWVDGAIVARELRLDRFLAEVARYRRGHLACDPAVASLRISGVFRLEDPEALLAILPRTLPVDVEYRTRWWVRVRAASDR